MYNIRKLVNKVMSGLNINFGGGANATVKLLKARTHCSKEISRQSKIVV